MPPKGLRGHWRVAATGGEILLTHPESEGPGTFVKPHKKRRDPFKFPSSPCVLNNAVLAYLGGSQTRGERATARARAGLPCVPKKEISIDRINPRGELAIPAFRKGKNQA